MNRLQELWNHRQAFWLDFISRDLMKSGKLKKLVQEDGLRGMTSNPTIFEKAIGSGADYDADLKKFAAKGLSSEDVFWSLAIDDIRAAAEALKPVFVASKGEDGYVSLEVSPDLANDTEGTERDAKYLFKRVAKPNVMIKIPGTPAGIQAIEDSLAAGVNINITLLFSVENYKQVLEAHLRALERRVKKGQPVKDLVSVASFFVSRVDVIIDKELDAMVAAGGDKAEKAKKLLHKAAVANAKLAYEHFLKVTASPRWQALAKKGARVQRLLWASTGGKDKRLPDTFYIDELIAPDTVNTMPPATLEAFRDHGTLAEKVREGVGEARAAIAGLKEIGVNVEGLLEKLQKDGVKSFSASFESLLRVVGAKRELLTGSIAKRQTFELGQAKGGWDAALKKMESEQWSKRLWEKDATLWKSDESHKKIIQNSLGWLTVAPEVRRNVKRIESIVADVRKAKFTNVLLLGMGGSSLCPEVLRLTFGRKPGYPDFAILDSTEPRSVLERAKWSKPEKTFYIVASKSGSTTEPNAFLAYFYEEVRKKKGDKAGDNFMAITDPGTQMEKIAKDKKFRHIVLNPPDIGGRFSALSYFGMVPAALMGIDLRALLANACDMADACWTLVPTAKNPGAQLGAALGSLAKAGRNKVTLVLSNDIASFSAWAEQLIAESTGKEGKGIVPVAYEPLAAPDTYGSDRVFVHLSTKPDAKVEAKLAVLKKAGHPVITIAVPGKAGIAGQFFLWEIATAYAGAFLGIDAFDQPNVQESKDLTKQFLEQFKQKGSLADGQPAIVEDGIAAYVTNGHGKSGSIEDLLRSVLNNLKPGDYLALLAYLTRNEKNDAALNDLRAQILKSKKVATTVGFGPRFLHSTGQLHKGGDDSGVFIQITANDPKDVPIPGEPYGFSVLKEAQALGDLSALANKHRRAVRIHLADPEKGLAKLREIVKKITAN
jgi:transaldolase / glucose-6-phosphate isomerase